MKDFTDLDLAARFHGHLGPNLVIGIKMGNYALRKLGARPYFGIAARVRCPDAPPPSCVVDGIQLAAGCTYGKRNIVLEPSGQGTTATFINTDSGATVALRVLQSFQQQVKEWLDEFGENEASHRTWSSPDLQVFEECDGC